MFTKPANEIEFSDVKDFCRDFGEGVRVEYKQQIKDIPKIVSSFANSLGGIFIIGAETDQENKVKFPIQGIPRGSGIEEQIQQSALTGIYPAVTPEVIILELPTNPNNVVIIIRVDESPQAPHAIQNSTRVYIRTGSITQPYELAEIDRIEYMLKRREDSQIVIRPILKQIAERIESSLDKDSQDVDTNTPGLTVIAHPVFPYRALISMVDIYDFAEKDRLVQGQHSSLSRVAGGVAAQTLTRRDSGTYTYRQLNEYGIVYQRFVLRKELLHSITGGGEYITFNQFVRKIGELIRLAQFFYEKCEYSGNIKVTAQLREVLDEKLMYSGHESADQIGQQQSADPEISVSAQYLPRELIKEEKFMNVVDEFAGQLLWAFNVNVDDHERREKVESILRECELVDSPTQ